MARRPEDVQIQVVMSEEMRRDLGKAALTHQDDVERDRLMSRGPMLAYLAKWFLSRPAAEQLDMIREGKRLLEGGAARPARTMAPAAVRGPFPLRGKSDGDPADADGGDQPPRKVSRVKRAR